MTRLYSALVAISVLASSALCATYNYDFGTGTGSFSTASTEDLTFLPAPPSGTARVRVGATGGSFTLANPGDAAVGSGTELQIVAPTSTSRNKFAITDFDGGKTVMVGFTVKFGADVSTVDAIPRWYFIAGDGSSFEGGSNLVSNQCFAGLRWDYTDDTDMETRVREGSGWLPNTVVDGQFDVDTVYRIEVIMNNSTSSVNYNHQGSGSTFTLAANRFDVWINNARFPNLPKGELPNDTVIDSFMIYGETSESNVAVLYLDDIVYRNDLLTPLPVELDLFRVD
ncbi:MAG: hypothetical protein KF858_11475 [Candidatus Sumerlaeia bacterium]|nr:hypothetical protein [Candidatus Sumerlaeia bacterium]